MKKILCIAIMTLCLISTWKQASSQEEGNEDITILENGNYTKNEYDCIKANNIDITVRNVVTVDNSTETIDGFLQKVKKGIGVLIPMQNQTNTNIESIEYETLIEAVNQAYCVLEELRTKDNTLQSLNLVFKIYKNKRAGKSITYSIGISEGLNQSLSSAIRLTLYDNGFYDNRLLKVKQISGDNYSIENK